MKREYQKPTMMVVQLQTMLLTVSPEVTSVSSSGLRYRGSDENYDEDAR